MAKQKVNMRSSWYYRIYFGLLALSVAAIIVGVVFLWGVLEDYEQARPKYVADEVVDIYATRDFETLYEKDTAVVEYFVNETKQDYVAYMQGACYNSDFSWEEAFSGNENEKAYVILKDGERFAKAVLEPTGEKSKYGSTLWQLKNVSTMGLTPSTCTVTVPSTYTVAVNGRTLGEADVQEANIAIDATGKLPSKVPDPTMTRYAISMYFGGTPEIVVTNEAGETLEVTAGETEDSYVCPWPTDESIKTKYEMTIAKYAQKLANYTSEDLSRSGMLSYVENSSPAEKTIKSYSNYWYPSHKSTKMKNVVTDNYQVYSDDCFSCTVSFDYVVSYANRADNTYPTKYTLYFHVTKKGCLIYNFTIG